MKRIRFLLLLSITGILNLTSAQNLWRVQAPNGGKTSFLFGTMHLANFRYLDEHTPVLDSLHRCNVIVAEVDMTDKTSMFNFWEIASYPDSMTLKKLLTNEEWKILDSMLALLDPPSEASVYNQFRPNYVLNVLTQNIYKKAYSDLVYERMVPIDQGIVQLGYREGFRMEFLETGYEQLEQFFLKPALSLQLENLRDFLHGHNDSAMQQSIQQGLQLPRLYFEQKLDSMAMILDASVYGDSAERDFIRNMLIGRNNAWMKKLEFMMTNNRCFVAVGAGHLVKDFGLIAQLRKRGFTVTPVNYR